MRKLEQLRVYLACVVAGALVGLPVAALAGGLVLEPSNRLELNTCIAQGGDGGSYFGNLAEGTYLMRVTGADLNLCLFPADAGVPDRTCATGGEAFPQGTVMMWGVGRGGRGFSCRGPTDAGTVTFTQAN